MLGLDVEVDDEPDAPGVPGIPPSLGFAIRGKVVLIRPTNWASGLVGGG